MMIDDNAIARGDSIWSNDRMAEKRSGRSDGTSVPVEPPLPSAEHDRDPAGPRHKYVPPVLKRLGNVRDIVGKTGPAADASRRHPRRP
jgi:hypothetical protein